MSAIALARPHPDIVEVMKQFIEETGCSSYEINSVSEIKPNTALIAVSTAVPTAPILQPGQAKDSTRWQYFQEVVGDLRTKHPRLPIIITTTTQTTAWMLPILRWRLPIAQILGVSVETLNDQRLLDLNTFVTFRKNDIEPDSAQFATARLMLKELTTWRP